MDRLFNTMRGQAASMDQAAGKPRFATVSSVDPAQASVRVMFEPESVLSGWLPLLSNWVGVGWGLCCPPTPGDQVLVLTHDGDPENGVVIGSIWNDGASPPATPSGELWMVHASGSFLKLMKDGSISAQATKFELQGNLQVTGNIVASGNVQDGTGTLAQLRSVFDLHTHNVTGDITGIPNQQD
jgi:phage baseplate assembly protein gpV